MENQENNNIHTLEANIIFRMAIFFFRSTTILRVWTSITHIGTLIAFECFGKAEKSGKKPNDLLEHHFSEILEFAKFVLISFSRILPQFKRYVVNLQAGWNLSYHVMYYIQLFGWYDSSPREW